MLEKDIQNQITDYLKIKNIFHYRNNTGSFNRDNHFYRFGAVGSPDIICVIKGQFVGIEVKKKGNYQSVSQKQFQTSLEKAGGKYILAYSLEDVINNL